MPRYLVSVPFTLHVTVKADSADAITDKMVDDALLDQHGKYAEVDVRYGGGDFEVIDELVASYDNDAAFLDSLHPKPEGR